MVPALQHSVGLQRCPVLWPLAVGTTRRFWHGWRDPIDLSSARGVRARASGLLSWLCELPCVYFSFEQLLSAVDFHFSMMMKPVVKKKKRKKKPTSPVEEFWVLVFLVDPSLQDCAILFCGFWWSLSIPRESASESYRESFSAHSPHHSFRCGSLLSGDMRLCGAPEDQAARGTFGSAALELL